MAADKQTKRRQWFWVLWLVLTLGLCGFFYYAVSSLSAGEQALARVFLPGVSTGGHHQLELACSVCHTEPFGGKDSLQNACTSCHAAELTLADDSHPRKKFTDPRNADTLRQLDARYCISCHTEHRPDITHNMGVTVPTNFCLRCHADVGKERPSHRKLAFTTCANGGCHNYHDNRALYEKFLLKHADEPVHKPRQQLEARDLLSFFEMTASYPLDDYPLAPLGAADADAPVSFVITSTGHDDWMSSRHAQAGVNCSACHQYQATDDAQPRWRQKPDHQVCQSCHAAETSGFLAGKHGMRLGAGLSAMTPEQARLPMRPDSHGQQVTCMSCHGAHRFDTRQAAAKACLQCHSDQHSQNYLTSPHGKLWQQEQAGLLPKGSGVSCATCHLPRIWHENEEEIERLLVDHNQNNTLRPNEKMLRPVCMQCHGLGFSLDALADPVLVRQNFNGQPRTHVRSIDMVVEAEQQYQQRRQAGVQD